MRSEVIATSFNLTTRKQMMKDDKNICNVNYVSTEDSSVENRNV